MASDLRNVFKSRIALTRVRLQAPQTAASELRKHSDQLPDSTFTWTKSWWSRGGSNSRPLHCERSALPAELRPRGCQCTPRSGQQIIRNHAYIPTRPGFVRRRFWMAYAWIDSRASIASSLSRSGISGNSLIILTRHNTGASSGQPSVVCSSRTSRLTRTSCGNPCVSTPK